MLEPYAPKGVELLDKKFVDSSNPPAWVGMDAWAASVCFNTVEAEKLGLPAPKSWKDLTDPVYAGRIIMPNPNSSGTGFLDRSEEHTSELQSLMRISYAVFCLKKK